MAQVKSESEGKAVVLTDTDMISVFDGEAFDPKRKVEAVFDEETIDVKIPARIYYKHTSTVERGGERFNVRTVVDFKAAIEQTEKPEDAWQFIAKLAGDQAKIKGSADIATLAADGETDFLIVPAESILEPGRADGGFRFSVDKYQRIFQKRKSGQTLSDEEMAYLADNLEAMKSHIAKLEALKAMV